LRSLKFSLFIFVIFARPQFILLRIWTCFILTSRRAIAPQNIQEKAISLRIRGLVPLSNHHLDEPLAEVPPFSKKVDNCIFCGGIALCARRASKFIHRPDDGSWKVFAVWFRCQTTTSTSRWPRFPHFPKKLIIASFAVESPCVQGEHPNSYTGQMMVVGRHSRSGSVVKPPPRRAAGRGSPIFQKS
jgi:hypothetical protein